MCHCAGPGVRAAAVASAREPARLDAMAELNGRERHLGQPPPQLRWPSRPPAEDMQRAAATTVERVDALRVRRQRSQRYGRVASRRRHRLVGSLAVL